MQRRILASLIAAALGTPACVLAQTAAVCAPTPFSTGPVNPQSLYPEYVQSSGPFAVALERCTDPLYCFFDPVIADNPLSVQTGTGAESFFWLAEARPAALASGVSALLVMAAEATYATAVPTPGQQVTFTRLRIRVDTPFVGTYTVRYPFGSKTYQVAAAGAGMEINDTVDIEFTANNPAATGSTGPWLLWDPAVAPAAPAGFIGDGATAHRVVGSPCGYNAFSVSATDLNGQPIELGGAGSGVFEYATDLFVVNGKLFDGRTQTPLSADRVSYARTPVAEGRVDAFANSVSANSVTLSDGPGTAPELQRLSPPVDLVGDGSGFYSRFETFASAKGNALPGTVALTARSTTGDDTTLIRPLVDQVIIDSADFDPTTGKLLVIARSSDTRVPPTLSMRYANADRVVGTPIDTVSPPARVTVVSSRGGQASADVRVIASATPAAPSLLSASAITSTTLTLAWTDNSSNETGFRVYRVDAGGVRTQLAQVGANVATVALTGLPVATTLNFEVEAINGAGASTPVATSATTLALPLAPANVLATLSTTQTRAINLSFVDNASDETSYLISRSTTATGTYTSVGTVAGQAGSGGTITFVDSSGPPATSTSYFYRVVAQRTIGGVTDSSSAAQSAAGLTTPAAPTSPTQPTFSNVGTNAVTVNWTDRASNETGYQVYRRTGTTGAFAPVSAILPAGSVSYTDTTVAAATQYFYRVDVSGWAGAVQSAVSAGVTTGAPVSLAAPGNVLASSATRPVLTWTDSSSGETGYRVSRATITVNANGSVTAGAATVLSSALAANATTYTEPTAQAANSTQRYDVQALDGSNAGAAGSAYTVIGGLTTMSAPTLTRALVGTAPNRTAQVSVSWTLPGAAATRASIGGYEVQRCAGAGCTNFTKLVGSAVNSTGTVDGRGTAVFVDSSVARRTTYRYRLRAVGGAGTGVVGGFGTASAVTTQ